MLPLTVRSAINPDFDERRLTVVHEWHDDTGVLCARGYRGAGANWMWWPGLALFRLDDEGSVEAAPDGRADVGGIAALYWRNVHPLALQALGWETLHASAVVMSGGIVGFCGDCEAGKSTLAYYLSQQGYRQYSDDSLVLQFGANGIDALDLPFEARLRPKARGFFGSTQSCADGRWDAPRLERITSSRHPLAALFVLVRSPSCEPLAERLIGTSALKALLPHARCFDARPVAEHRRVFEHYLDLVSSIPVYALHFAAGFEHLPALAARIEESVNARCPVTA
jgi:hypothetical protein